MAFTNINSIVANDVNNMLRGLSRDNADSAHTGDTNETNLSTLSITGGTVGTTGTLHILATGTVTNSGSGAKTIKLILGSTTIVTVSRTGANAQDWIIDAWMFNISTSAQRWTLQRSTADAVTTDGDFIGSNEDTTANLTLKVTATLANGADTVTQTMFNVFIVQVT